MTNVKLPHRRQFLHLAAGVVALPAVSRIAKAQTYPSRPVRLVVGFAAGGGGDVSSRLMVQWLSDRFVQNFILENRPGAAGNIATEAVVRAPPDGYTLLVAASANAMNATLYDKLNFNFIRDITPIAGYVSVPNAIVVNPSVSVMTVPEFIAYTKTNPGKINMASAGIGSPSHLSGELFKAMTGVNMVHVPYRGAAPALADLIGGQVQVMFTSMSATTEHIRAGRLRVLAIAKATRWEGMPDIPTVGEFLAGYESSTWWGFGAPKNTPAEIVDKLNKEINAGLADPMMKARLADLGGTVLPGTPADFGKLIADETEKWGKVVKFANIKPE